MLLRSQTDARLVDLTRDGNERAFEAIVQRYRAALLRYCSRLLPATRAEDAVQQAFLSAHRAIHAGDAELNLRPWLYRIAHNASLNLLRQHGFDHDQVSEEIDGVETPPQAFERSERLRTVVAAVQELPDRQRDAIVLRALEGRSYEEIATELGVTDGAVRQLLNRARNTLREAAAALTPTGLLTRLAASGAETPVAERIAAAVVGGGGGALLAKAGATLVVAGAVTGGAVSGGLPVGGEERDERARGVAAVSAPRTAAPVAAVVGPAAPREAGVRQLESRRGDSPGRGGRREDGGRSLEGERRGSPADERRDSEDRSGPSSEEDRSGPGHGGSDEAGEDRSGSSGGGDHSGSGRSGSDEPDDDDNSGSGSGDDDPAPVTTDTDNSGSGSSGSGSGSSGSGSSGSGKAEEPEIDEPDGSDSSGPG